MILEAEDLKLADNLRLARLASIPDPMCDSGVQARAEAQRWQAHATMLERKAADLLIVTAAAQRAGKVSFDGIFADRVWQFTDAVTGTTFTLPITSLPTPEQITRAREAAGIKFTAKL